MDAATAEALNQLLHSVSAPADLLPILDSGMVLPVGQGVESVEQQEDDQELTLEKTDPRLQQPSSVPEEFKMMLSPLDYRILDLWSRGVATRKISKALKEIGEEGMTQKAVEAKINILKTDPGFTDPDVQNRYMEWIEDIVEERQPKSAQQKWDPEDEEMLIRLRVRDGLPTKEIAARMQRTPKAIERKWSKLRRKLDLPPTVPNKGLRVGSASPTNGAVAIEDLLAQVQSAAAMGAGAETNIGQNVISYRPPPANAAGRKRKRAAANNYGDDDDGGEYVPNGSIIPEVDMDEPRFKRVKMQPKYSDMEALHDDDPAAHLAAAVGLSLPGVPVLPGPMSMGIPSSAPPTTEQSDVLSLLAKLVAETGSSSSGTQSHMSIPGLPI